MKRKKNIKVIIMKVQLMKNRKKKLKEKTIWEKENMMKKFNKVKKVTRKSR